MTKQFFYALFVCIFLNASAHADTFATTEIILPPGIEYTVKTTPEGWLEYFRKDVSLKNGKGKVVADLFVDRDEKRGHLYVQAGEVFGRAQLKLWCVYDRQVYGWFNTLQTGTDEQTLDVFQYQQVPATMKYKKGEKIRLFLTEKDAREAQKK